MYGMGDQIRGMYEDMEEMREEHKENMSNTLKDLHDAKMTVEFYEYVLNDILEWYWNIKEPGNIENGNELHHILRYVKKYMEKKQC